MPRINFKWFRNAVRTERKELHQAYRNVFSSPQGQAVLKDLYENCQMDSPTFVMGQPDASAWNEGRRSVFLFITKRMGTDPQELEQEICDE